MNAGRVLIVLAAALGSGGVAAAADGFDLFSVQLPHADAETLLVAGPASGAPELCVVEPGRLVLYPLEPDGVPRAVPFPAKTLAFDVAHAGLRGRVAVFLTPDALYTAALAPGAAPALTRRVSLETGLTAVPGPPVSAPLAGVYRGSPVWVAPGPGRLDLFTLDGRRVARIPQTDADARATLRAESRRPYVPGQTPGPWLQSVVVSDAGPEMLFPPAGEAALGLRLSDAPTAARNWDIPDARDVVGSARHGQWPSFPLMRGGPGGLRAQVRWDDAGGRTQVVIARYPEAGRVDGEAQPIERGPERAYPGLAVFQGHGHADFNGDGYADLLCWSAPAPGLSASSAARLLASRDWPLRLTVHLFEPSRERFAPRPAGRVEVRAPLNWFLSAAPQHPPVRNLVVEDLNGDGRTDLGFSPDAESFWVWLSRAEGPSGKPDFQFSASESIGNVAFHVPAVEGRGAVIGLRGDEKLHVIRTLSRGPAR